MNLISKQTIKKLLEDYNIRPSKRLGQNFLVNKTILKKIIDASNISPKDTIVEIGPGLGTLTIELARQAKKVITVEKDRMLCGILKEILKTKEIKNVKVVNKDILQISNQASSSNYKIVANLPYYITSPVIRKFLEAENKPRLMILMVQKEVAQRIVASPPKMNLLTVAVQFYAEPKIIDYVSKKSFWPIPKVDSAILRIVPRNKMELSGINTEKFFMVVKAGFSSKRKQLINSLSKSLALKKEIVENILNKININPKSRAEMLTIKNWLDIYRQFQGKI